MNETNNNTSAPPRRLGFWMCLALVIGNMIGSGVFLLPASLAQYGLNSVFGWILTATGGVFLAMVFAHLARVFPQAGGPYVYPRAAFGELAGFLVAWGYWMSTWVGNAAIAIATVAYLAELVPAIKAINGAPALTSCGLIWILTFLNYRGVQHAGVLQVITTVLKILPLIAVVILALILLGAQDTSVIKATPQPFTLSAITASATLTLWALTGLESATVPAENVINPKRNIPLATLWGTVITAVIYVVACSAVIMLLPGDRLAESSAPFAEVVSMFWGERAGHLLALFAFISGFGALNGWVLVQGEMPRVLAKEGVFPRLFARESKYQTPGTSLFITSGLVTVVMLMNYSTSMVKVFTFIILVSTSAYLVMYLFCSLAAFRLAWRGDMGVHGRRLMGLLAIAMVAASYSVWTLYGAGKEAFLWAMALLAVGLPVYMAMKWQRRRAALSAAVHSDAAG